MEEKELSLNFIEKMNDDHQQKFILQIINIKSFENDIFEIILSNGIYYKKVFLNDKNLIKKLHDFDINGNFIIESILNEKDNEIHIKWFQILYKNVNKIGQPISYYFYINCGSTNFKGTNKYKIKLEKKEELVKDNEIIYIPINLLKINSKNFYIKVKVKSKISIKNYGNLKEGKFFVADFIDKTGFIQGIFFNDIVDTFYNILEEKQNYIIKNVEIKNLKLNASKNPLQILFNNESIIKKIEEDIEQEKNKVIDFIKIKDIKHKRDNDLVDIIGIVEKKLNIDELTLKNGIKQIKRNIYLKDDSNSVVEIILWGDNAKNINPDLNEIMLFTNLNVKDWKGKQLHFSYNSEIIKDVKNIDRYKEILEWKNSLKNEGIINLEKISEYNISNKTDLKFKKIGEIIRESKILINNENNEINKTLIFDSIVNVVYIRENFFYISCTDESCRKKAVFQDNFYICEKCKKSSDIKKVRYMPLIRISDDTDSIFCGVMNDQACLNIYGCKCEELKEILDYDQNKFLLYLYSRINKTLVIKIKSKYYANQNKVLYNIISAVNINNVDLNLIINEYLKDISKYKNQDII